MLILGNIINVLTGFFCWGKTCHNIYVCISILPALSSGLHFAIGSLYHTNINIATCGFLLQGTSSILTYFMFKQSDEILKLFALCRFFELYFIVPHYVGYFNSRFQIVREMSNISYFDKFMYFLGCYSIPLSNKNLHLLENYFNFNKKKIN